MYEQLVIIGASGHGKVVADMALKTKRYNEIIFLDNDENKKYCLNCRVVGKCTDIQKYLETSEFIVAIGDSIARKKITDELNEMGAEIATLIHPTAYVGECVNIGKGSVVMPGAIINSGSSIGNGCIINTSASVDHDCCLGDYVHVSVGAHLCGSVSVGEHTWIGAGVIVKNCISIISNCMIGIGAIVVKDIHESGTYIGVPAKKRN